MWCGGLLVPLNPHLSAATRLPDRIPNSRADVRLTECAVPCKTTASVKPLSITTDKAFTYSVKFVCPKSKTKDRDTAVLMLQLPNGFSVVSGKSSQPTSAQPVTDANNLVTWTIPCSDSSISLSLKIKASTCSANPNLIGTFCYGNACQQLKLPKAPSMKC